MAKSRYEYVKKFEQQTVLLPGCWTVIRVDGHKFSSLVKEHNFQKPNDDRGLELMTDCAREVMRRWPEICLAYGHSDEFSMLLPAGCELYGRRAEKLASSFAALFASCYVHQWGNRIKNVPLSTPPAFDGRAIALPSSLCVRDYFSWRQVDCHINNLHNTTYYGLMQVAGLSSLEANQKLKGTSSANKNEVLFTLCGINYNDEPVRFRKGTVLWRKRYEPHGVSAQDDLPSILSANIDLIADEFWLDRPDLLFPYTP